MCSCCCDVPLFSIGLQLVYVWIALHRHETLKLWFLEAWIYSRQWFLEVIFKEGKWLLGLGNARPTNLRMKSRHLIGKLHAASRDGYSVCLHRPTQGWTVGEYILLGKVSRLHPPSSLGLDGEEKSLPHHDD